MKKGALSYGTPMLFDPLVNLLISPELYPHY